MPSKNVFIILILCFMFSCVKEELKDVPEYQKTQCVPEVAITSYLDSFLVFYPYKEDYGLATGIKINKEWESSAKLIEYDTFNIIGLKTMWEENISEGGNPIQAELLDLHLPKSLLDSCYNLTNNASSADSIYCRYTVFHGDVIDTDYILELDSLNKLEIIEFDIEREIVKFKFMGHFKTSDPNEPFLPKIISFLNVTIDPYNG